MSAHPTSRPARLGALLVCVILPAVAGCGVHLDPGSAAILRARAEAESAASASDSGHTVHESRTTYPVAIVRGSHVFEEHCAPCHPHGNGGVGPALDRPVDRALLRMQVRRGMGIMPAFDEEKIDDRNFEALADYVVALRHARILARQP